MGFVSGLAKVGETLSKKESSNSGDDRVKAKWLALKADQSVKIVFLQEVDEGAENYSAKNGLVKFYLEHTNPNNWRKKAECTVEEDGGCYGCENGWTQKVQMYVNVLVDDGKTEPYVAVLSRGTGKGSVAKQLLEYAVDDETITDKWFKFKREGSTKDNTTYYLMPSKAHGLNVEDYELFDLDKVVFHVNPERQEAYYLDGQEVDEAPAASRAQADAVSVGSDSEW